MKQALILWALKQITRITMDETLDTTESVFSLTFKNGQKASLWTTGRVTHVERFKSIMQPIGTPFPPLDAETWPKKSVGRFDGTVRTVTPY